MILTHEQVYALARWAGLNDAQAIIATAVGHAESGDNPANIGDKTLAPFGSDGEWQEFTGAHPPNEILGHGGASTNDWTEALREELFNPYVNAKAMALISNHGTNWGPWSTFNSGAYRAYLPVARAASKTVGDNWSKFLPPVVTPPSGTVRLANVVAAAHQDAGKPAGAASYPADVHPVGAALVAEGLLDPAWAKAGAFGRATVAAYKAWQIRCGYSGPDADGIPGKDSLTKLGAKHGFGVV